MQEEIKSDKLEALDQLHQYFIDPHTNKVPSIERAQIEDATIEIASLQKSHLKNVKQAVRKLDQETRNLIYEMLMKIVNQLTEIEQPKDKLMNKINSAFLFSDIKNSRFDDSDLSKTHSNEMNSNDHQGLFINFQDRFILMNINSPLA